MTRELLSVALARQIGHELTPELALAIAREADTEPDLTITAGRFEPEQWHEHWFQCEPLRAASPSLRQHREHYLAETQPGTRFDTDWGRLLVLQRRGAHVIFTARDGETARLVASIWLYLDWNIDTGACMVTDDLFYVEPASRGGMLAARLWRYAERAMFAYGVREAVFHSRIDNGAVRMAHYLGYRQVAIKVHKVAQDSSDFSSVPTRRHKGVAHEPLASNRI
jgi:hypothetical protein